MFHNFNSCHSRATPCALNYYYYYYYYYKQLIYAQRKSTIQANQRRGGLRRFIYGCSINRILKKTLQYVYLGFSMARSSRNYFQNVKTKAVASDSRKVNGTQCRQSRRRLQQEKEVFRDALLDLVGINLRICGISIDPGHRQRCF